MIRIAVIGLAAVAALTLSAPTASAGNVNLSIGFGSGFGVVDPYYPYGHPLYVGPVGPAYIDPDCHYVTKWKWVQKKNGKLKKKYYQKLVCY
jgi:hypothetical protein